MRTPRLLAVLVLLGLASPARGDDIVLQGGTHLTGIVLERSERAVRVLLPAGAELTFAPADVQSVLADADAPQGESVTRFRAGKGSGAAGLQVALITLVHPETGRRVDLVGAVHIADSAFFREVQRVLEHADVVLYEMVKPQDAEPEDAPEAESPVRAFQQKLARWFGLEFQMDAIAYDRPHFVHADVTLEEFQKAGEGTALVDSMKQIEPQMKMVEGMVKMLGIDDPTRGPAVQRMLKGLLGRMLGSMGGKIGALLGSDVTDLLIRRRNEVAVQRLTEVPAHAKSVAIFYGAAHLPDLEQRVTALGYVRVGSRWMTAWNTSDAPTTGK